MSETWNLEDLRQYIRSLGSEKQSLLQVVNSIDRSVWIFRYHFFTAKEALEGHFDKVNPTGLENLKLVLDFSADRSDFVFANVVSEAHLIACIQTVRSMCDILSHLINGLFLPDPLSIKECNIHRVNQRLPDSILKTHLQSLLNSYWFKYVSAFINTAKHRQLVKHTPTISIQENYAGVRVGAFDYKGTHYSQYWGVEVLDGILTVKNKVITCGPIINQQCLSQGTTS